MRGAGWIVAAATLAGAADAADPRGEAAEHVVTGDGVIASSVAGAPARLRVTPHAPGLPILNRDLAARAGLKGGMFGAAYAIGPVRVSGETAVTRIALGGAPVRRRVAWGDRDYVAGADAAIGPGGLPHGRVRFQLRAPRPGERTVALPLADAGGLFGGWGGLFALVPVDGAPTRLRFDLDRSRALANAGAARALANAHGGRLEGAPGSAVIGWGVARPVRRMRLARSLAIGPLTVAELDVRTADGDAFGLPDADAPAADPDEVVVTAKGKRDRKRDAITLGREQLDRCSSIVFDKRAKRIRLSCL